MRRKKALASSSFEEAADIISWVKTVTNDDYMISIVEKACEMNL